MFSFSELLILSVFFSDLVFCETSEAFISPNDFQVLLICLYPAFNSVVVSFYRPKLIITEKRSFYEVLNVELKGTVCIRLCNVQYNRCRIKMHSRCKRKLPRRPNVKGNLTISLKLDYQSVEFIYQKLEANLFDNSSVYVL